MTQNSNILQELKELKSNLVNLVPQNIYTVPEGYFENLPGKVMNRIKAMDAVQASEELTFLSPVLNTISKEMPYTLPRGYFDGLEEKLMQSVRDSNDYQTAKEELVTLSPLLSGLTKQAPYQVPNGYFETLSANRSKELAIESNKPKTRVISLTYRRWFRFAAAAVITGVVALGAVLYISGINPKEPGGQALAKFTQDVKKLNDTQKNNLIEYIDGGLTPNQDMAIMTPENTTDIKELLKGVSDKELKDFQEQTEGMEDVLMTN